MKLIDKQLLDDISRQAKQSDRLRMNYNFHQSLDEKCHRFLNAVEPGTKVEIHRHPTKDESFVGGVMWILRECFGINEAWMLCPVNGRHGQFLLSEIMMAGNFGHYDSRVKRIDVNKRFERGVAQLKKNLRFLKYYPSEVLWSPFWKLWHWCWRKKKGYL